MGKGKKQRRNTAKTGDKALYKQRSKTSTTKSGTRHVNGDDDDDDAMYSKVDRFYNQADEEDYIQLTEGDQNSENEDDDDEVLQQEAVLDLGGGDVSSSDEEEKNSDTDDDDDEEDHVRPDLTATLSSDSDGDDDEVDGNMDDVRNWGSKKSVYYHGDTADLEIGQEHEDAFVEEEAANEVQMARMKELSEQDFVLSSDSEGERDGSKRVVRKGGASKVVKSSGSSTGSKLRHHRDTSSWTIQEQRTFLQEHHPEFLPLVTHFTDVIQDFEERTDVVVQAFYESPKRSADPSTSTAKEVGATPEGERYLLSRALLQSSAALNLTIYLLLKSVYATTASSSTNNADGARIADESIMSSHPVLDHLQKLHHMAESMEQTVNSSLPSSKNPSSSTLNEQINSLVKASVLLNSGQMDDEEDDADGDGGNEDEEDQASVELDNGAKVYSKTIPHAGETRAAGTTKADNKDTSSSDDDSDGEQATMMKQEAALMNEARFGLRLDEVENVSKKQKIEGAGGESTQLQKRHMRRERRAVPDFGEDADNQATRAGGGPQSLYNTVNSLEQRFATSSKKRLKNRPDMADQLDDLQARDADDSEIRRGLELMEAELGKLDDDDDKDNRGDDGDDDNNEDDYDDEDVKFYRSVAKASQEKKKQRKDKHTVAPKYPRLDPEVEGDERPLSRTILKNRGLVPHKNKLNRNPRVKKREQFRKALIRRKGAVRSLRDPREGQAYGGEETGIKSGLKRSRSLV
ncbi:hypothetical protein ACA910_013040 [Epithemia clementina (nom. ined.)]